MPTWRSGPGTATSTTRGNAKGNMIRVDISQAAFDAIAKTLPELGHVRIGG